MSTLLKSINESREDNGKITMDNLYESYGLKTLNIKTVQNWMKKLGFKFEPRKKSYYVDTHETAKNIAYRSKFIDTYFELELLPHRWYSITDVKQKEMIDNNEIRAETGFEYEVDGKIFYEYHVDIFDWLLILLSLWQLVIWQAMINYESKRTQIFSQRIFATLNLDKIINSILYIYKIDTKRKYWFI